MIGYNILKLIRCFSFGLSKMGWVKVIIKCRFVLIIIVNVIIINSFGKE